MTVIDELKKKGAIPAGFHPVILEEQFQFTNEGDNITGRIYKKETVIINGNKIGKYYITRSEDNKNLCFLGSVILDQMLSKIPTGQIAYIAFTHKEKADNSNNLIKYFTVAVQDAK